MSSMKSVPGQPVASPDSTPAHQTWPPVSSWIFWVRSISSVHVCGTSYPASANIDGEYQTKDFALAPSGAE